MEEEDLNIRMSSSLKLSQTKLLKHTRHIVEAMWRLSLVPVLPSLLRSDCRWGCSVE